MSDTTTQPTELLVSLKVASNAPLDFRGRFYRMAEAIEHAYEGMPCYVMETGKYYIFLRNAEGNLYPSDQFADLALYALKTDVTAEIQAAVAALVAQSPATLDTLNELAKALNDDPNFATTITALIGTKVDKETGKSLMTDAERAKLQAIESEANKFVHPANHPASIITEETNKRFMTDAERAKLAAIEAEANKFVHPANHPASMIEESTEKQFVSEAQKQKLNNLPETVQTYTHPANHPASIITEETNKRFMTDAERAKLANIQSGAMNLSKGEIEIFDEIELNDLSTTGVYHISQYAEGITNPEDPAYRKDDRGVVVVHETYGCISQVWFDSGEIKGRMRQGNWSAWRELSYTHPNTHPASMIVEGTNKWFMTDAERAKLIGIAPYANNYSLPSTLPASMIVEETNRRFMTDSERAKLEKALVLNTERNSFNNEFSSVADNFTTPGIFPLTQLMAFQADGFLIVLKDDYIEATITQIYINGYKMFIRKMILSPMEGTMSTEWVDLSAKTELAQTLPLALGTAAKGESNKAARADHVHPIPANMATTDTAQTITSPWMFGAGTRETWAAMQINATSAYSCVFIKQTSDGLADSAALFRIDSYTTSNLLRVLHDGRVGIGMLSPQASLHINNSADRDAFRISQNAARSAMYVVNSNPSGGGMAIAAGNGILTYILQLRDYNGVTRATIFGDGSSNFGGSMAVTGNIRASGEITPNYSSDKKLKKNIRTISDGLSVIRRLRPVEFDWNDKAIALNPDKAIKSHSASFIAQEFEEVLPFATGTIYEKYKSIEKDVVISYLTASVQQLEKIIGEQDKKLELLERRLSSLENQR